MTTEQQMSAVQQPSPPAVTEGYIQFGAPGVPFSAIHVPLAYGERGLDRALVLAKYLAEKFRATFPDAIERPQERLQQGGRAQGPSRSPQTRNAPRGGGGGQRGEGRAERFEQWDGEECDTCGGPVGLRPRTGNMKSGNLVCLGKCRDGQYVHTVRWLEPGEGEPY